MGLKKFLAILPLSINNIKKITIFALPPQFAEVNPCTGTFNI